MAEPIRNPEPFPNQELETEREHLSEDIARTPTDPGMLASEAAEERIPPQSTGTRDPAALRHSKKWPHAASEVAPC